MRMNKKTYTTLNLISDFLIFALMITGFFIMFFTTKNNVLASKGFSSLKYFTVQSNIFMGLMALISAIFILMKRESVLVIVLKYIATVAVTLTFMTVMVYLGPAYGYGMMFNGANLIFHLLLPVLSILHFLFLEPKLKEFKFRNTLYALIPLLIYGTFYLINVGYHGGEGNLDYDWYLFAAKGMGLGIVVMFLMIGLTYLFSLALYFGYKKINLISKNVSD